MLIRAGGAIAVAILLAACEPAAFLRFDTGGMGAPRDASSLDSGIDDARVNSSSDSSVGDSGLRPDTGAPRDSGPPPPPCFDVRLDYVPLRGYADTANVVQPIGSRRVLVAGNNGGFFVATSTGAARIDFRTTANVTSVYSPDGDELWIGAIGVLLQGNLRSLRRLRSPPNSDRLRNVAGRGSGMSTELFFMTHANDSGRLLRFASDQWQTLWGPGPALDPADKLRDGGAVTIEGSTVWALPRASTCATSERCLVEWRNGEAVEHDLVAIDEPMMEVENVPGVGLVIGTRGGRFFMQAGGVWSELRGSPIPGQLLDAARIADLDEGLDPRAVRAIVPDGGGFVYFTDAWIGRWDAQDGFCAGVVVQDIDFVRGVNHAIATPEGFAFVGRRGPDNQGDAALGLLLR